MPALLPSLEELSDTLDRCPRCDTIEGRLVLLTSMHRYFSCGSCTHRWNEAVNRAMAAASVYP